MTARVGPGAQLTIGAIVDACIRLGPGLPAATLGDRVLTFADLDAEANRVANTLNGLGVRPGDVVVWWSGADLRTLAGFVGCARAGAVFAPLNPAYSLPEAAGVLEYLQPDVLVSDANHLEVATDLAAAGQLQVLLSGGEAPHARVLEALARQASARPPTTTVDDRAPHIVYLTSGSTGTPKGALVSHRASWLRSSPGGGTFGTGLLGRGGVVTGFPLFHYGGWQYVLEAWQNRRPIHLVHRAAAAELTGAVERWGASALYAIPAVWERILDEGSGADLGSLEHADTGTSSTPAALLDRIRARVPHATTTVLYGSTEAGRMAALPHSELQDRPGSVGRPATPGTLWVDDEGEVCCSTPAMMEGYLRLPEATGMALRNGYYHSGDVGHFDDEGYLYLTGRTSELIRTGGEWVGPVEVEDLLKDLPGVVDLAVFGLPDERWGEVVCLAVVCSDGSTPDVQAVQQHIAGRLARFKLPRRVVRVEAIPRTAATGQVQRRRLRGAMTTPR